jgi:hypothetical protein
MMEGKTMASIIGYTYKADNYTPGALIKHMVHIRELSPAARWDMTPEGALDQLAAAYGIDRDNEYSFDSDEFPKVIGSWMDADPLEFVGASDLPEWGN